MSAEECKSALKAKAHRLGFAACGVCGCEPLATEALRVQKWLDEGGRTLFPYRDRPEVLLPRALLPGAQSAVVVFLSYFRRQARPGESLGSAKLSRYLWGPDYHSLVWERLQRLLDIAQAHLPGVQGRICVDTSPLLERAMAVRAGVGWQGKNTLLIAGKAGSFGVLGVLLLDAALPPDLPWTQDHCGHCRACVDACPSAALRPFVLDPIRCMATYTLETESEPPSEVLQAMKNTRWVAGCDKCQEVCPWNRCAAEGDAALWGASSPLHTLPAERLVMGVAQYRKHIQGTALRRVRHRHWLSNLARIGIVTGS